MLLTKIYTINAYINLSIIIIIQTILYYYLYTCKYINRNKCPPFIFKIKNMFHVLSYAGLFKEIKLNVFLLEIIYIHRKCRHFQPHFNRYSVLRYQLILIDS